MEEQTDIKEKKEEKEGDNNEKKSLRFSKALSLKMLTSTLIPSFHLRIDLSSRFQFNYQ
jgi:hypothetical protein